MLIFFLPKWHLKPLLLPYLSIRLKTSSLSMQLPNPLWNSQNIFIFHGKHSLTYCSLTWISSDISTAHYHVLLQPWPKMALSFRIQLIFHSVAKINLSFMQSLPFKVKLLSFWCLLLDLVMKHGVAYLVSMPKIYHSHDSSQR